MKKIILCGIAAVMMLATTTASAQSNAWNRKKYFNIGYVMQTIDIEDKEYKSDVGASISWGKQYYLHSKPIAGLMKFAIDYSWFDVNYASFKLGDPADPIKAMQMEYAMQVGPSFTINPVQDLKICLYYRVSPSATVMKDDSFNFAYVTNMNLGGSIAWNVISLGVEYRWGSPKYKTLDIENFGFTTAAPFKTGTMRFYFGFRF